MKRSVKLLLLCVCAALCAALFAVTALAVPAAPGCHTDGSAACRSHTGETLLTADVLEKTADTRRSTPRRAGAPAPAEGELPLVVIVMGFSDFSYRADLDWAQEIFRSDKSLAEYYTDMSFGKFTFAPVQETSAAGVDGNANTADSVNDGVIHVSLDTPHDDWALEDTYLSNDDIRKNKTLAEAQIAALEQAGAYIDFAAYDANGDGAITTDELAVAFVAAGYEASSASPGYPKGITNYLWAFAWSLQEVKDAYSFNYDLPNVDGVTLDSYIIMSEQDEAGGQAPISTLAHELGHYIGLPDLYDVDYSTIGEWKKYSVGILSLMDAGAWGVDPATGETVPYSLDAWSRAVLGWTAVQTVNGDVCTLAAQNYTDDSDYSVLRIPVQNGGEYYLLENRGFQKWDAGLALEFSREKGGIILWHIDEEIYDQYEDDNTVNNVNHRPAVMPLYPESTSGVYSFIGKNTTVETDAPFFDSVVWSEKFSALGAALDLPVYGTGTNANKRSARTLSGVKVEFLSEAGDVMRVLPNADAHVHRISLVTKTAPTCTAPGTAIYECPVCGKQYADAAGTQESNEPFAVDALGHTAPDTWGKCTRCGEQIIPESELCVYCGHYHTGVFGGLISFFHKLLYYAAKFFGLR